VVGRGTADAVELWTATGNRAGRASATGAKAEQDGFDGASFGDTQCLSPDPFVGLAVAAGSTQRLKLGVRVANPVTRHPATVACAIATVHVESNGRAVLGVGRGDSAVAQLGLPAAPVGRRERFVAHVQGYLAGGWVEADGVPSALRWLREISLPKVPVDVAATGPAVIAAGVRQAEQVTFNVGADPERLRRAIAVARVACQDTGRGRDGVSLGAYVNVVAHHDRQVAHQLIKGPLAAYAHFSGMPGHPVDALPPEDASVVTALAEHYDSSRHARSGASHVAFIDDDFVERFGVVGSPERCTERLAELVRLGLDRIVIVGPAPDSPPVLAEEARALLVSSVLPELRRALGH
jgi:5,10-methylenetetrahydromethanopterin reductase